MEGETWNGLHFRNADEQVLKGLKVKGATTGLKLENSGDVELTQSEFIENNTAIEVLSSDGIRNRQNRITNTTISGNQTGIRASSTGVIVENNHIKDIVGTAVNLSGGTCGAGSRCGWSSEITNNLIENSAQAIYVFGHYIKITKNDIYNITTGVSINFFKVFPSSQDQFQENNIGGWRHVAVHNLDKDTLNIGSNWIQDSSKQFAYCDIYENISYGKIVYTAAEESFTPLHAYSIPTPGETGTLEEGSCALDGYNYLDVDQSWESLTTFVGSQFIAPGTTISASAGSTIKVPSDIELIFGGSLEVIGDGMVTFEPAVEGETWNGLHFRNADEQVLKGLKVKGATTGLKLENSGDVELTQSEFIENNTAIEVLSSDGIRNRQNRITNTTISGNQTGIRASSTGVIVENNIIEDSGDIGISFVGNSCGGGGACGYNSEAYNNSFFGNRTSVTNSAHHLKLKRNNFSCNSYSLRLNLAMNINFEANNNNFGIASPLHIDNVSALSVDLGEAWFYSNDDAISSIFDAYDDPLRGPVDYSLLSNPFLDGDSVDDDSDGYTLLEEYENQSCPHLADSDNDGVKDDADKYALDARYKSDSDSDGMPDAWESFFGLDPNDPNDRASDDDGDGLTAYEEFIAGSPAGLIDIDGDGRYDALSDGLIILRSMFGLTGDSLVAGVISSGAAYKDAGVIESRVRILNLGKLMDIDGQGTTDALTDGLLSLRYMFGLENETLIKDVLAPDAIRKTAPEIQLYLEALTR